MSGYTGRKLIEYTWIPKSKTYLREYREFLKLCKDVQNKTSFFNDKLVGELMVKKKAIVDRDSTPDSYVEKYKEKSIGNQSYVSNARMLIRICRWLGWITKIEGHAKFILTAYGENLTKFNGSFPSEIGEIKESELMEKAFAKLKFYNVNDSVQYRNPKFKQRIFLNMLRVLNEFDVCSHYELVVSAFVLKDERNEKDYKNVIDRVKRLKNVTITIGEALAECNLDCKLKSTVTGVYDGPKVMLSFARQFGFVENIPISSKLNPKMNELYKKMYRNSGYIKPHGAKFVSHITEKGRRFLKENYQNEVIWYDELTDKIKEAAILCILNHNSKKIKLSDAIKSGFQNSIKNLSKQGIIKSKNDFLTLNILTDFDYYQDVPYEVRPYVLSVIKRLDENFLDTFDTIEDVMETKELFISNSSEKDTCYNCASPPCKSYSSFIDSFGASDRFADRVCPVNCISIDNEGNVEIDRTECVGCMLCIMRCPFNAIKLRNNYAEIKKSSKYEKITYGDKIKKTEELMKSVGSRNKMISLDEVEIIIKNFEGRITIPGKEWKKDKYYLFIRNIFRSFGLGTSYTGSGGMKTRSDVTIFTPFLATSEVKSPAEGPINLKAVRQSFDAAIQLGTTLTMAIGSNTHMGAIEQERKYNKITPSVKINLIESKYLHFLVLIRDYLSIDVDSIKRMLTNNSGYFNKEALVKFIESEARLKDIKTSTSKPIIDLVESIF